MALKQANRSLKIQTPLGEDSLLLTAFQGQEEMSRLFQYELELISDSNSLSAQELVGKPVTISIELAGGGVRHFHGFVQRFCAGDEDDQGRRNYRASVVPWLWFLTRTTDCRIFQHLTVPRIIEKIFGDLGFSDFETSQIKGKHPEWEYCVQYRETDFNFVSRLMEQEGIFYYFKHAEGKHTLVLADQKGAYQTCQEAEVDFPRDFGSAAVKDHLTGWEHVYAFRTGKWAHTDYNFKTPGNNLLTAEQTVIPLPDAAKYEFYDYPGEYESTGAGTPLARIRMEEEEVGHDVVHGSSFCKSFLPGYKFRVRQHRSSSEDGKRYVLTSVQHFAAEPLAYETGSGQVREEYRNTFTCIPDSVVFRSARQTPKPVVQGLQTAVVTGPKGEEIYPDQFGRVKVQFHWDREGKRDEHSSCWMRVSQIHAGQGWGYMDIPRIGEEVIVDFLEGDPDRPIITGRVYNGANLPPFALPGGKTRRGNTTKTYQGSGFNELSMDDTAGAEQIRIHAQYNLDTVVEHDETHTVHNNRTKMVDVDESMTIGNNQTLLVGVNKSVQVGANHTEAVAANQAVTVGANQSTTVGTVKTETVGAVSNEMVGAVKTTTVGAAYALTVGAAMNTAVGFVQVEEVGIEKNINVGSKMEVTVGSDLKISAGENIELSCGSSKVTLDAAGKITIAGTDVTMKAGAGKIHIDPGGIITIKGPMVKINT